MAAFLFPAALQTENLLRAQSLDGIDARGAERRQIHGDKSPREERGSRIPDQKRDGKDGRRAGMNREPDGMKWAGRPDGMTRPGIYS